MRFSKMMIAGCLGALLALGACEKDDDLNATDRDFMTKAAYGNLAEIDAGRLASEKGEADSVRMFGSMMVTDHQKAHAELDSLADKRDFTLPTAPDAEHQALKQLLETLSERDFDTTYMNSQIVDHKKTIELFEKEVSSGNDKGLRNYASSKLPALRMHLTHAESIRAGL
jgi:putative membrane protein